MGRTTHHDACIGCEIRTYRICIYILQKKTGIPSRLSSGVYICKSVVNDLKHESYICKSEENYLQDCTARIVIGITISTDDS